LCIFICMFDTGVMEPRLPAIHDEDLVRDGPRMRYLVADRLETIWNVCEPHLDGSAPRPDHRYVDTALKVLARLSLLYRLEAPAAPPPVETTPADTAKMVESRLRELESRLRPAA
jgi:hypothetical protein